MPRSAYTKKKDKRGRVQFRRDGKLISEKAYNMGKSRQKASAKTKNTKSKSSRTASRSKRMAKNGMFSNSKANRTAGALLGAAMPRFLGANTPYVALAAALLPKMPTALKVAGTVWASKELTDTFIGGNNNG